MPNLKASINDLRKSKRNHEYNKKVKDGVKSLIKKGKKAIEAKDKSANEAVMAALKALDKAAQKGVIKKNTRDRKKSRLHKKLNTSLKEKK